MKDLHIDDKALKVKRSTIAAAMTLSVKIWSHLSKPRSVVMMMDLMLARAPNSVTKIAVPKPRYIQKIIDKFVRYLLHNRNNQFVFLSQEYMFICSQ